MTKIELFLELAGIDDMGYSRWVCVDEFQGKYEVLKFGNGRSWARGDGKLGKMFNIIIDTSITPGNKVDCIKLDGYNSINTTNNIRGDIKSLIRKERCPILGISEVEVDHRNGRKNDPRVLNTKTQEINDFQPLSRAANLAKRQACKNCKKTGCRFNARILGYKKGYYYGNEVHDGTINGCYGCFWYDPIEFRNKL